MAKSPFCEKAKEEHRKATMMPATRLASFASLVLVSSLLGSPSMSDTATAEIKQVGEHSLLAVEMKKETLNFTNAAIEDLTEKVALEELILDDEEESEYDDEEDTEVAEAYSTTISSPAVAASDIYGSDLGVAQIIDAMEGEEVKARISDARIYMRETVMVDQEYEKVRHMCSNKHENCAFWASTYEN